LQKYPDIKPSTGKDEVGSSLECDATEWPIEDHFQGQFWVRSGGRTKAEPRNEVLGIGRQENCCILQLIDEFDCHATQLVCQRNPETTIPGKSFAFAC